MSQLQSYFGRFRLTASMLTIEVHNQASGASASVSMNSGRDLFTAEYDGEPGESLCKYIQATIRAQTGHSNAVVNYSPSNGRVTFHFYEQANLYFSSQDVANIFGFSNSWVNGDVRYCGDKAPRYTWRPSRGLADHPLHINTWYGRRSTSKVTRSVDGTVRSIQGNELRDGRYSYRNLPRNDVTFDPANPTDEFRSFETFWVDCIHPGAVVRVYPDRENMNSDGYHDGVITAEQSTGEPMDVGSFDEMAARSQPPWDSLWDVDFTMVKNV